MSAHALTLADAHSAFARYERIQSRLPAASFPITSVRASNIGAIASEFDAFVLDSFGVLNIGETTIPTARGDPFAFHEEPYGS